MSTITATIPLSPALEALSIPQRMLEVIRRRAHEGQATTRDDFHQAEETCDLTDAVLDANIGQAVRLANPEVVRHDQPPAPVHPWDADRDYRRQRVDAAAERLCGRMPREADIHLVLREAGYSARELGALWPEIIAATGDRFIETRGGH